MPLLYSIEESKKDNHKYVTITGFEGSVSNLVVPDEIEGLPVEVIGGRAFSGRQDITSVELPETVNTLGGFAFHNCREMKRISLYDSLDDYYDGVCRQCDSLRLVEVTINRGWFEVVRNFLADNDKTLRFILRVKDNSASGYTTTCLTFPEYVYDFNENTMARTIQFSIAGSGMFYRECVDRRSIDYHGYDRLFEKAVIDGNAISEDIALGRLLYPVDLLPGYRDAYESFVRKNAGSILKRLVENAGEEPENIDTVKRLLDYSEDIVDDEAMDTALKISTKKNLIHMSAVLMNARKPSCDSLGGEFVL